MDRTTARSAFLAAPLTALLLSGCGLSNGGQSSAGSGHILVAAAESFWGSIATQLGGSHVTVTSIIVNPATDPHAYEPTPQDSRTMAQSQYVVVNGAGYDAWAPKLVDANPSSSRRVLTVADLAGRREGDNPHMWYSPPTVMRVIDRVTSDYKALDPADAAYFDEQAGSFRSIALQHYNTVRAAIRSRYGGVAVGATESIFVDLASDLGLHLVTPPDYMKAISEGNDPSAGDKSAFDSQVANRQVRVLAFNRQNSTPDIQALVDKARAEAIPVVAITETLDPPTATFQDWQSAQLDSLQAALAQATGR